ncbi:MAG: RsmD family RNA methyltransferase [Candidatus Peribacteraceae bacterium]|nr:RsmD family RNA methyltransferase [Candidatus Peribacteraceae bacterium]
MTSYCAFLGHQPHISIAELSASIPDFKLQRILGNEVLLFESALDLHDAYLHTLGGTVAIARKAGKDGAGIADVPEILRDETKDVQGKIVFSLRGYGVQPQVIRELYRTCKSAFKQKKRPVRYVGTERTPAPSVLLRDEGMLDGKHGAEIVMVKDGDRLWIGRTTAAQDVNAYAKRDMHKPVRDTTVGLLPPKLAQILLNFGQWLATGKASHKQEEPLTILDPFCGTGVIPMECLLRRWHVLASDASQKAVNGCEKNMDWLRKEHDILKRDVTGAVWKHDARKPFELKKLPDVIVTESTLGPPLEKQPSLKDAQKMKTEAEALQTAFLQNVAATLPGVPVVVTWPTWFTSKGYVRLEKTWDKIHDLGFRIAIPAAVDTEITGRPTLLYRRPNQFVGREIVLLQQTKK